MQKLLTGILLSVFAVSAANIGDWNGTWKLDVAKSDFSKIPVGLSEATLIFTKEGWTYHAVGAKGQQFNSSGKTGSSDVSGSENTTIRGEHMINPFVMDVRFGQKYPAKETMRVIGTLLPDGKTMLMYDSGVGPGGKEWSDVRYFNKIK